MSITQSTTDQLILEQHDRVLLIKLNRPGSPQRHQPRHAR